MLIKQLRERVVKPRQEVIINKTVNIRGVETLLVSIVKTDKRNLLYALQHMPAGPDGEEMMLEDARPLTNRKLLVNRISRKNAFIGYRIPELVIQGQRMNFTSSRSNRMDAGYSEGCMLMQHYFEKGLTFEVWDDKSLSDIMLAVYEQDINEEFPGVDESKEMNITLRLEKYSEEKPVYMPLRLEFGDMGKGNRYSFSDPGTGRDRVFYLNRLEHYDYWGEMDLSHWEEFAKTMPAEHFEAMKQQQLKAMEQVCPRGMDLAVLEYETEDDIQLNFYASKYLDEIPERRSSAGAVGVFSGSDRKTGINGYRPRLSHIIPVEKDFYGSIDVELFSWYREFPGEEVQVTAHPHA